MTTETLERPSQKEVQNVVLRCPAELLERIDTYVVERGGSRHSAILHLLTLGIGADAEIAKRVGVVKRRLRDRIEPLLAEANYP